MSTKYKKRTVKQTLDAEYSVYKLHKTQSLYQPETLHDVLNQATALSDQIARAYARKLPVTKELQLRAKTLLGKLSLLNFEPDTDEVLPTLLAGYKAQNA